jgi:hypothetical protein
MRGKGEVRYWARVSACEADHRTTKVLDLIVPKLGKWPNAYEEHLGCSGPSSFPELRFACLHMPAESRGCGDRTIRPIESIGVLEHKKIAGHLGDVGVGNNDVHGKVPQAICNVPCL